MVNAVPKKIMCIIIMGFLASGLFTNISNAQETKTISKSYILPSIKGTYTIHTPININGNGQFDAAHGVVSGAGTVANPYMISGWEINTTTNSPQILINNTDKYFTIKNCYIHGCNYPNNTMGITFSDVRNGTVTNNTITGKYYRAVYIVSLNKDSYNNIVSNNTIYGNQVGVWLHSAVSGGPATYNDHVNNNYIHNNSNVGIVIGTSSTNYVLNNSVMFNGAYGIILHDTWGNYVTFNRIFYNHGGMELDVTATTNHIFSNDFVFNNGTSFYQATAADTGNYWNTGSLGNYWSDYQTRYPFAVKTGNVWNYSYSIYGVGGNKDNYPLANPENGTPSAPTLFHPYDGIRNIGNKINLTWFESYGPGTIAYDVFLGTTNPPSTKIATHLNMTYFNIPTIDGTKYYWRVRANNSYGNANSTIWNFTENAEPFPPTVPITPLNGAKGIIYGTMNVTWNASVPDPDGDKVIYYWYVDNKSSMDPPYVANGTTAINRSANFIAQPSTTYYWRVRANDSYEWSNWSNNSIPWNFTTMKQDTSPRVTIFTPTGGEVWHNSTIQEITWNATGDTQLPQNSIKLFYSIDGGTGWNLLNNSYPNNGTYYWIIPDNINSTQCLVKVECTDFFSLTTNKTSNLFTITNWTAPIPIDHPPKVIVISPNGGEVWNQSTIHMIKWNATDDHPLSSTCINISYSANNGTDWTIIGYKLPNNGTMAWLVPDTVNSTQCLIKVECTDSAMQTTVAKSNKTFTIQEVIVLVDYPPQISILAPKGGETWYGGEVNSIKWNATDDHPLPSGCINITFSLDGGSNWTFLALKHTNNGNFQWLVPRNDTTEAMVRVSVFDSKGQSATDTSGKFTIEKWNESADTKPVITSTPITTATVGTEWTYTVVVNDTEVQWGDILNFSLEKAPQGMVVNSSSGLITWTPTDAGNFSVTVKVTDSVGLYANQTFNIKVTGSNLTGGGLDFGWLMIGSFLMIFLVVCILIIIETRKRKTKKIDEGDTSEKRKKKIYEYIAKHPDDDSESISKALDMQKRDLETDVGLLVDLGYVETRRDGKHRRYTVKKPLEEPDIISETTPAKGAESKIIVDSVKPRPVIVKKEESRPPEKKVEEPKAEIPKPTVVPVVEAKQDLKCPTCGAKVTADMAKCQECGEVLKKAETVPAAETKTIVEKKEEKKIETPKKVSMIIKTESETKPRMKLRARILIHLLPYERLRTEAEAPEKITIPGIADSVNAKRDVVNQALIYLEDEKGYVIKEYKHVKGHYRQIYAYFLTTDGQRKALLLKKDRDETGKR